MMPKSPKKRYWEIDFVRGVALIMMILSNLVTDLQFFLGFTAYERFWWYFARLTASLFVSISGVSLWISHFKSHSLEKYLYRFVRLFGLGVVITFVTFALLEKGTIYFGVLHFLGLASLLSLPFYRFKEKNIFFALFFLFGSEFVQKIKSETLILLPLGITPENFFTLDYFPIFPWFGIFLIGLTVGSILYPHGERRVKLRNPSFFLVRGICLIGRHTLLVYLIHQPILVSLLFIVFGKLPHLNLGI